MFIRRHPLWLFVFIMLLWACSHDPVSFEWPECPEGTELYSYSRTDENAQVVEDTGWMCLTAEQRDSIVSLIWERHERNKRNK